MVKNNRKKNIERGRKWKREEEKHEIIEIDDSEYDIMGDIRRSGEISVSYMPDESPSIENIIVRDLKVSVMDKILLEGSELKLSNGNRYGLIGPNGSGKSTLLKIISERLIPINKGIRITQIDQMFIPSDESVYNTLLKTNKELYEIKELMRLYYEEEYELDIEELENRWEELEGEKQDKIITKILLGLGFSDDEILKSSNSFSGGWQRRIELGKMLYLEPDILLLDEPTNHLDLEGVLWLMDYLEGYDKIILMTSHSKDFLNGVCNQTIFLENNRLRYYKGYYERALYYKLKDDKILEDKHNKLKKRIESMKKKSATNKEKERVIEESNLERLPKRYEVRFPEYKSSEVKSSLVCLEGVSFGYDESIILENINLEITQNTRLTLVGRNGAGKSTLLKLIGGYLRCENRSSYGGLKIGYYDQHFDMNLPYEESAVSYLCGLIPDDFDYKGNKELSVRSFLGSIKLCGSSHLKRIECLSGGEKARVAWLAMIFEKPHLILLDEPTNHLDMETIEGMIKSLECYNGGLITITHDPTLISSLDSKLLIVRDKGVSIFDGDLDDYRESLVKY